MKNTLIIGGAILGTLLLIDICMKTKKRFTVSTVNNIYVDKMIMINKE